MSKAWTKREQDGKHSESHGCCALTVGIELQYFFQAMLWYVLNRIKLVTCVYDIHDSTAYAVTVPMRNPPTEEEAGRVVIQHHSRYPKLHGVSCRWEFQSTCLQILRDSLAADSNSTKL